MVFVPEPIVRGRGGKPHICEQLFRQGGKTVYVSAGFPNGITEEHYARLEERVRKQSNWRVMRRNPTVYVRVAPPLEQHRGSIVRDAEHRVLGLVAIRILYTFSPVA